MSQYRVRVFAGWDIEPASLNDERGCEYTATCSDTDWEACCVIRIPGFDGSSSTNISALWAKFRAGGGKRTVGEETSYETIVKFGNTRQLETRRTFVIDTIDQKNRNP